MDQTRSACKPSYAEETRRRKCTLPRYKCKPSYVADNLIEHSPISLLDVRMFSYAAENSQATQISHSIVMSPKSPANEPIRTKFVVSTYHYPMTDLLGELARNMGTELLRAEKDTVVMRLPVEGNRQIFGLLHGGANGVLVEHAASLLGMLNAPEGRVAVGTELNVSQLHSATAGKVTATATLLNIGRSSLCSHVEIHDESGTLTAVGRMTVVFIPDPGASTI